MMVTPVATTVHRIEFVLKNMIFMVIRLLILSDVNDQYVPQVANTNDEEGPTTCKIKARKRRRNRKDGVKILENLNTPKGED